MTSGEKRTLAVIALVGTLLCAPALLNVLLVKRDRVKTSVPGSFFSIAGKDMHIDCTGSGGPTLVLEHAASASYMLWRRVQPQLSTVTQVCSYDRAGHGWSPTRANPRDAEVIVHELHDLLDKAGVRRPFIYVGHSAGGLYVREYAREYPNDLAAVALLDASSPYQIDQIPGWRSGWLQDLKERNHDLWRDKAKVWSGWDRLAGACRFEASPQDRSFAGLYQATMCRPDYVDSDESELPDFGTSSKEAARLSTLGSIPLLVLSQDPSRSIEGVDASEREFRRIWQQEQEESKQLSPLSWRVIAAKSGHMIPLDRPDLVIKELTLLIAAVRGQDKPPYRSTSTM